MLPSWPSTGPGTSRHWPRPPLSSARTAAKLPTISCTAPTTWKNVKTIPGWPPGTVCRITGPHGWPPTWGASPATWRWTAWTKPRPKSAAVGRPLHRWTNWPSAWPPPAVWRIPSMPPRPGGSSASFCAPCPRRPAIFFCGGTGTAMPPPTLRRVTA